MHTEDQTISDTIAAYERLRAFVDERIEALLPEEVDVDDTIRDTLADMNISDHIGLDQKIEEAIENEDLDGKVETGIENYMSYNMDIDDMLEHADADAFVRRADTEAIVDEALRSLLVDKDMVHMIRTALAEVPAPEETEE